MGQSGVVVRTVLATLTALVLAACTVGGGGGGGPTAESPGIQPSTTVTPGSTPGPAPPPWVTDPPRQAKASERPIVGAAPPAWLGTRVLPLDADGFGQVRRTPPELVQRRFTLPDQQLTLPGSGFDSVTRTPAPPPVVARSTWKPGCPVAATDLSWVRLTFWGFDGARHTGELLVNSAAADDLVTVFRRLYAARFPIEEMRITRKDELDAPPTGDGNNTGVFACRPTVGATTYSQHAYGLAIDVNPFQNPYVKGDVVLPELASSYLERDWVRPGMITADGPVVRAFDRIGWTWGGTFSSLKDLQHFSANGR
jgi:hypothetical protein